MSRSSKKLITILLLSISFLVGCGVDVIDLNITPNSNHDIKPIAYESMGKPTYSPIEIPYAIDNPIKIINIDASTDTNHHWSYFQISGLIDQAVEDHINEEIKLLFEQMLPYVIGEKLPPYRGIESAMHGDRTIGNSTISVSPHFNCNNVLSTLAHVSVYYHHSTYGAGYFSVNETLNFDLNTGKAFLIGDVFTNDVDALKIVNDSIVKEHRRRSLASDLDYHDDYANFALVAPFKGISHDQKFYLSLEGLTVVIDYNNPEFDVGFSPAIAIVPFYSTDGSIAIAERFYDKNKSVFTEDAVSKRFLRDYQLSRHHEMESYNKNGTQWYVSTGHPENLPKILIDIMNALRVEQEIEVELLSKQSPVSFVEQNTYANRMGPYFNISNHLIIGQTDESRWQEISYVYAKTGELIGIEDLFVEEYDYLTLIKNTINKTTKEYGLSQDHDAQGLLEGLTFRLNDTSISFVTKPFEWNPRSSKHPLHLDIPYEEVGYKNLKIFD